MKIIGHGITSDEFSYTVMCLECTCYYEASKGELDIAKVDGNIYITTKCPECGAESTHLYSGTEN